MATITKYTTRKGTFFKVQGYLGTDPMTGLPVNMEKRGFETKKEAQLYFNTAYQEFHDNSYSKKVKDFTYKEVYDEWLEMYKNTVKESTLHKTMVVFRDHILPKFGKCKINMIEAKTLQKQAF